MVDVREVPDGGDKLMSVMRRPLSPDATIEVPASWDEYQRAQELLDVQGNKFPRLRYDGKRQIAIVVAAPTPLHGDMVESCKTISDVLMIVIEVAVSQSYRSLQEAISWWVSNTVQANKKWRQPFSKQEMTSYGMGLRGSLRLRQSSLMPSAARIRTVLLIRYWILHIPL
ncbi:hypothetical protein V1508DRAFT_401534 [Lipomyces doorenjongii]|uniref:uncharacterized protein n=1 Tax=Lipomyces doorenjongii TaxID=383834 RepID=UPI0034CEB276